MSNILEYLELKNVGPIKKAKIETKKINVFIGKNATGKSIVAKLLQVKREKENLKDYNLDEFIKDESKIVYKSNKFVHKKLSIWDIFIKSLEKDIAIEYLKKSLEKQSKKLEKLLENSEINLDELLEKFFTRKNSYYIPVERNLVPFFSSYGINLLSSKIPLPQYVVEFATEFRLAKDKIKSKKVLNFEYKFEDDEDKLYFDNKNYISLKNASSGIQTILPLYLTIEYLNKDGKKHYILEEPELNLFPKEQFELVKYMVKNSESTIFITHSPYVLYSLNLLIYAFKVGNMNKKARELVENVIPSCYWIDYNNFSAYYFEEGKIKKFFKEDIEENLLDDVSLELEEIFDELREIYIRVKNEL